MRERVKQALKQFPAIVQVVRASRARAARLRRIPGRVTRGATIAAYLSMHSTRKLQIGAGTNRLAGWLNTDAFPGSLGGVFLDARERFPLPAASFDYVFSEHQIEHIGFLDGRRMLGECHRVLKPGGRIRIATPDLATLVGLYADGGGELGRRYVRWIVDDYLPEVGIYEPVFVINNAFRNWGHEFLYDGPTLRRALEAAGFVDVTRRGVGESDDPHFQGVESHGEAVRDVEMNRFETLVLEARRPAERIDAP